MTSKDGSATGPKLVATVSLPRESLCLLERWRDSGLLRVPDTGDPLRTLPPAVRKKPSPCGEAALDRSTRHRSVRAPSLQVLQRSVTVCAPGQHTPCLCDTHCCRSISVVYCVNMLLDGADASVVAAAAGASTHTSPRREVGLAGTPSQEAAGCPIARVMPACQQPAAPTDPLPQPPLRFRRLFLHRS